MAWRLTRIYTRTGDGGHTGLANGERRAKDDALIHAIGEVDELNACLALVLCDAPVHASGELTQVQHRLFDIGAELAVGVTASTPPAQRRIRAHHVVQLENWLDEANAQLPALQEFILPGGGLAASRCHLARAVCRRAERALVSVDRKQPLNPALLAYVNRLSDYLFVLCRVYSREAGQADVYWQPEPEGGCRGED